MEVETSAESVSAEVQPDVEGSAEAKAEAQKKYIEDSMLDLWAKTKVDGKEIEVPLKEALKDYELRKASFGRMEKANLTTKQMESLAKLALENPEDFYAKVLKKDPAQVAYEILKKHVDYSEMTDEQKQVQADLEELKRYRAEKEEREKLEAEQKSAQEYQEVQAKIDQEMAEAFKSATLPRSKFFVQQAVAEMLNAERQNKTLSPAQAVAKVESNFRTYLPALLEQLDPEKAIELIGPGLRKKMREYELKQIGKIAPSPSASDKPKEQIDQDLPWGHRGRGKPISERDYRRS